jgi:zinc transport system permease protein
MLDDFLVRALIAGLGVAAIAGPLGCFVVWRRLSFFGDTLSHGAILGVALALALQVNIMLGVFVVALLLALLLLLAQRKTILASDAILSMLSHGALSLGLVAIALMSWLRVDLLGLLFGDILAVSKNDIGVIYLGGAAVLAVLIWQWRGLLASTVSRDIAVAEQSSGSFSPTQLDVLFTVLLAIVIAVSVKIIGVALMTALLVIPAGAARGLSRGPVAMIFLSAVMGCLSVVGGLLSSLKFDVPAGPAIVVVAVILFALGQVASALRAPQVDGAK